MKILTLTALMIFQVSIVLASPVYEINEMKDDETVSLAGRKEIASRYSWHQTMAKACKKLGRDQGFREFYIKQVSRIANSSLIEDLKNEFTVVSQVGLFATFAPGNPSQQTTQFVPCYVEKTNLKIDNEARVIFVSSDSKVRLPIQIEEDQNHSLGFDMDSVMTNYANSLKMQNLSGKISPDEVVPNSIYQLRVKGNSSRSFAYAKKVSDFESKGALFYVRNVNPRTGEKLFEMGFVDANLSQEHLNESLATFEPSRLDLERIRKAKSRN